LNPNVKAHQNPSISERLQRATANIAGSEFASFAATTLNVKTSPGNIEDGSTNVYADLGYADAAEMQGKSQLAAEIARAIKARRLTQSGAAELLGIDQSKVSRITRGQFRGVSEAKLLELVAKLGRDIKIVVGPMRRRVGKIELQFA
jgi:predicted XRE-type DNA-binding protein